MAAFLFIGPKETNISLELLQTWILMDNISLFHDGNNLDALNLFHEMLEFDKASTLHVTQTVFSLTLTYNEQEVLSPMVACLEKCTFLRYQAYSFHQDIIFHM